MFVIGPHTYAFFSQIMGFPSFLQKGLAELLWLYLVFSCASIVSEILMEIYQILNPK